MWRDAERVGRWLEQLTRAGLVARGINYVLVGVLAVQVGMGDARQEADRAGALRAVSRHTGGAVVLWLLAAGFAALAIGRLVQVVVPRSDGRALGERATALVGALIYIATSVATVAFVLGGSRGNDNAKSQDVTTRVMTHPGGRFLVGAVGIAIGTAAVVNLVRAARGNTTGDLDLDQLRPRTRRAVMALGVVGEIGRTAVFGAVAFLLVAAAVTFDPRKAQGLDGSLRKLAAASHGSWVLVLVAAGLIAFGLFSCCQARWYRPAVQES
ncbi:DUF1206 domain-containing protein [Actinomadura rupiterrae]|uniref:DUF1206 domain-containing protein n=1 Tax=Actinomadura rupiterrae TaxID=559627 RepID=UPI0020A5535A|nr:DUF1206 domain-containing protein [Actinomadura rupiterrae]MCP2342531.1 hypothetical protein [Actinomadura rupiterrae]